MITRIGVLAPKSILKVQEAIIMTQTFCNYVLTQLDHSQAYPERVVRHLLLTLACEGMDQESSFALDTLAVVLWR